MIGKKLKHIREKLQLTQEEFGLIIGKTKNSVGSYELGKQEPRLCDILELDILAVSFLYIAGKEDEPFLKGIGYAYEKARERLEELKSE